MRFSSRAEAALPVCSYAVSVAAFIHTVVCLFAQRDSQLWDLYFHQEFTRWRIRGVRHWGLSTIYSERLRAFVAYLQYRNLNILLTMLSKGTHLFQF